MFRFFKAAGSSSLGCGHNFAASPYKDSSQWGNGGHLATFSRTKWNQVICFSLKAASLTYSHVYWNPRTRNGQNTRRNVSKYKYKVLRQKGIQQQTELQFWETKKCLKIMCKYDERYTGWCPNTFWKRIWKEDSCARTKTRAICYVQLLSWSGKGGPPSTIKVYLTKDAQSWENEIRWTFSIRKSRLSLHTKVPRNCFYWFGILRPI